MQGPQKSAKLFYTCSVRPHLDSKCHLPPRVEACTLLEYREAHGPPATPAFPGTDLVNSLYSGPNQCCLRGQKSNYNPSAWSPANLAFREGRGGGSRRAIPWGDLPSNQHRSLTPQPMVRALRSRLQQTPKAGIPTGACFMVEYSGKTSLILLPIIRDFTHTSTNYCNLCSVFL